MEERDVAGACRDEDREIGVDVRSLIFKRLGICCPIVVDDGGGGSVSERLVRLDDTGVVLPETTEKE